MEYLTGLAALGGEEREKLARALLSELSGRGTAANGAEDRIMRPASPAERTAGTDDAAGAETILPRMPGAPARGSTAQPPYLAASERRSLLDALSAAAARRAAAQGSGTAAAENVAQQRRQTAALASAAFDAEAISRAVRRAARCEDAPYERY